MEKEDMMTGDPEGETYWKVTHGIRLSGMPGFGSALSDTERWQVTMLVKHADNIPPAAKRRSDIRSRFQQCKAEAHCFIPIASSASLSSAHSLSRASRLRRFSSSSAETRCVSSALT